MQYLIIENQVKSLQYLLASLNWREVAREARRREFLRTAVRYNQLIIPKEFTLLLYLVLIIIPCSFYLHKIILIHTKVPAPSKHRANNNHCNPCHGAPSRRALHGVEILHLRRCRGLESSLCEHKRILRILYSSLHGKQLPFSKNHIPCDATMGRERCTESTSLSTQQNGKQQDTHSTFKPTPAQGAKRVEQQ